jgi:hypothetical protein
MDATAVMALDDQAFVTYYGGLRTIEERAALGEEPQRRWAALDPLGIDKTVARARQRGAEELDKIAATRRRLIVEGRAFVRDIPPVEYIARPIGQRGQVIAITGNTGHGKSTVIATVIACGIAGRNLGPIKFGKPLRILALIGENPTNGAIQLAAAMARYGVTDADLSRLHIVPMAARLVEIMDDLRREAEHLGELDAIFVDTAAAFFSYTDEIDNVQAGQHARDCRELTSFPGNPAVFVPCHPTKKASIDNLLPRGGGAFVAELDANLWVWNDGETVTLHHNKLRGPAFEPIRFRLEPQDTGLRDEEGRPIAPPVAVPLSDGEEHALAQRREQDENRLLFTLLNHPEASIARWAELCGWMSKTDSPTPLKSKVARILDRLAEDRLVKRYRGSWVLTAEGKREAERD